jgi:DNA (cytosine-5)-methyltransferase 1
MGEEVSAYYNEIDPYAAQWLRNLIKAGHIADGEVDTRSIVDVAPDDIRGFTQAHFFAGIGGWSHALRLAGWPDDRPIWTGSCPCQPFSVAGKGAGVDDPRHLWPHFFRLIAAVQPPVVMGEQVAGAAGYGWLDGVRADLEAEGYASRGVDIPACAVDAPHIRSRIYWVASDVADADSPAQQRGRGELPAEEGQEAGRFDHRPRGAGSFGTSHMADADDRRSSAQPDRDNRTLDGTICGEENAGDQLAIRAASRGASHMADADQLVASQEREQRGGQQRGSGGDQEARYSFWSDHIWLTGADGKARRAQPGIPLLAHGIPNRVGKLRAYGNAIVPQIAAEVIGAYMDCAQVWGKKNGNI